MSGESYPDYKILVKGNSLRLKDDFLGIAKQLLGRTC